MYTKTERDSSGRFRADSNVVGYGLAALIGIALTWGFQKIFEKRTEEKDAEKDDTQ